MRGTPVGECLIFANEFPEYTIADTNEVRLEMDFIIIDLPSSFCFKAGRARGGQKLSTTSGIVAKRPKVTLIC